MITKNIEKFESWWMTTPNASKWDLLPGYRTKTYANNRIDIAWRAWQAATNEAEQHTSELIEAMHLVANYPNFISQGSNEETLRKIAREAIAKADGTLISEGTIPQAIETTGKRQARGCGAEAERVIESTDRLVENTVR